MAIGSGRTATQDLTRVGLAVAPARRPRPWWKAAAALVAAIAAGGAAGYVARDRFAPLVVVDRAPAAAVAPAPEVVALRQQLEQSALNVRLAHARSQELERQIDALHQKLTESEDELTFFRKAKDGRKR